MTHKLWANGGLIEQSAPGSSFVHLARRLAELIEKVARTAGDIGMSAPANCKLVGR